jgi:2,4'-dihydroxyacetophenone dioxygenase
VAYDSDEPMKAFFVVAGPLIWLDEDGASVGHFDVHDYIALARGHYAANGVGADYVDTLLR